MPSPIYSPWDANTLGGVVPTCDQTVQSSFPLSNLTDGLPATLCKLSSATQARWVWPLAAPAQIDVVLFANFNVDAAHPNVFWQGNSSNAWGSPARSVQVEIPSLEFAGGYRKQPFVDLTAGSRVFQYWSLVVSSANSVPLVLGEVWGASAKTELTPNFSDGLQFDEDEPLYAEHRTGRGLQFNLPSGVRVRSVAGQVECGGTNAATEFDTIRRWWRVSRGRARPFLFIPDPAVNDGLVMGFTMDRFRWTEPTFNRYVVPLSMMEYSRGAVV